MKRIKPNSLRTIELTDGGVLLYDESFLPGELADRYFVTIRDNCGSVTVR